jgi:hypothetical protein
VAGEQETQLGAAQTSHKRRVNDLIYESLAEYPQGEPIGFFCECSSERCFDTVWLTVADYEAGRADPQWAPLIAGHR